VGVGRSGGRGDRDQPRIPQAKLQVKRSEILAAAYDFFEVHAKKRVSIRVEFIGEEGIGLGPTLEFFTIVAHQLQKKSLGMWLDQNGDVSAAGSLSTTTDQLDSAVVPVVPPSAAVCNQQHLSSFHEILVIVCKSCSMLEVPVCHTHQQLFSVQSEDGSWRCAGSTLPATAASTATTTSRQQARKRRRCSTADEKEEQSHNQNTSAIGVCSSSSRDYSLECSVCRGKRQPRSWLVHDDEARYLAQAWTATHSVLPHRVLCCSQCHCVNFPGTANALTMDRGGRITTIDGKLMHESAYRDGTVHLSALCEGCSLTEVPVLLTAKAVEALAQCCENTPSLASVWGPEHSPRSTSCYGGSSASVTSSTSNPNSSKTPTSSLTSTSNQPRQQPAPPGGLHSITTCDSHGITLSPLSAVAPSVLREESKDGGSEAEILDDENKKEGRDTFVSPAPLGLFPAPLLTKPSNRKEDPTSFLRYFRFLGRLLGQALLEGRLLDIPLSLPFFRRLLRTSGSSQPSCANLQEQLKDLLVVYPAVGKTLMELNNIAEKYKKMGLDRSSEELKLDGCCIEDLCLDFTLPGASGFELKSDGAEETVCLENLAEYVSLVADTFVGSGVSEQFKALVEGVSEVCSPSSLLCFTPAELSAHLCGEEGWDFSVSTLRACVKLKQGYTIRSRAITHLFEILADMTPAEQRGFVRFVTGCPRLPIGGLKNLRPCLSIIRVPCRVNHRDSVSIQGELLPSVMTCSNFLKLPDYPSLSLMKEKLFYSISECQTGFQLS